MPSSFNVNKGVFARVFGFSGEVVANLNKKIVHLEKGTRKN